ncbi:MAG: hypothetical protein WCG04_01755 [Alphaproteobacteria bacterium]
MKIKKMVLNSAMVAMLSVLPLPSFAADADVVAVAAQRAGVPMEKLLNTTYFTSQQQEVNLKNNRGLADTLRPLYNKFDGFDKNGKQKFSGVGDTAFHFRHSGRTFVLLVEAGGKNPKFNGGTWSFPGGKLDGAPEFVIPRELTEETAGALSIDKAGEEFFSNLEILHMDNDKFKGEPTLLGLLPAKMSPEVLVEVLVAMEANYAAEAPVYAEWVQNGVKEGKQLSPFAEKSGGAFVELGALIKGIIHAQENGLANDNFPLNLPTINAAGAIEERLFDMRKRGVPPFIVDKDMRAALEKLVSPDEDGADEGKVDHNILL